MQRSIKQHSLNHMSDWVRDSGVTVNWQVDRCGSGAVSQSQLQFCPWRYDSQVITSFKLSLSLSAHLQRLVQTTRPPSLLSPHAVARSRAFLCLLTKFRIEIGEDNGNPSFALNRRAFLSFDFRSMIESWARIPSNVSCRAQRAPLGRQRDGQLAQRAPEAEASLVAGHGWYDCACSFLPFLIEIACFGGFGSNRSLVSVAGYARSQGKTPLTFGPTDLVCCRTLQGHTGKVLLTHTCICFMCFHCMNEHFWMHISMGWMNN